MGFACPGRYQAVSMIILRPLLAHRQMSLKFTPLKGTNVY